MTTKEDVLNLIEQLEDEADTCSKNGSSSASECLYEEAGRLKDLLSKGIIP